MEEETCDELAELLNSADETSCVFSVPTQKIDRIILLTEKGLLWKPGRAANEVAPVLFIVGMMFAVFFRALSRTSGVSSAVS